MLVCVFKIASPAVLLRDMLFAQIYAHKDKVYYIISGQMLS